MANKISRRHVIEGGAAALAVGALRIPDLQRGKTKLLTPVEALEAELAQPLTGAAKSALPGALAGVESTSRARLRHALTENSEPSLIFKAMPKDDRSW